MSEASTALAQHYHQRTKYDPQTLSRYSKPLDWATQPSPYKDYPLGHTIDLKPYLAEIVAEADNPSQPGTIGRDQLWWQRLSRFLVNSYGLTAKLLTYSGEAIYLRSAPSAGGLYPAELYLISRGTSLLSAGLYNYQVRNHTLLRFWDNHPWQALQEACYWHPALANTQLAVVVTTVFQRSAWRYQDRAYRRICLDSGHLLGNLEMAASLCDFRPHLIGGFIDEALNQLLYLDTTAEGAIATLALADLLEVEQNLPRGCTALPSPTMTEFPTLSDGELLSALHQASQIDRSRDFTSEQKQPATVSESRDKYNLPFCPSISTQTSPLDWGEELQTLEDTIIKRRSTRRYTGGYITLEQLRQLLDFTYHPHHYSDQGLDSTPDYFDLSLIETFIVAINVNGLDPGCYYYAPQAQSLRQIRFKQFQAEIYYLCLNQDLGRDAAAVIFHTADLKTAITHYGERTYRYLHLDAGHLGQRLNVAAIGLDLGVSGIAGFFDDQVNEVLGIPADEAVLYITTIGQAGKQG
jgi:SagB-type dehydrogenase family enzyme